ncbi:hypothetical protein B0A48_03370 [Cryoendolithus antarcticus]|uniref:Xylanolytic transcriptional activator regulatory domain-containing protein n=1 Tax=Cryoendolithus antarcticus TaxID=1507870 RepID=A0A1V8TJT5_9PEZI|nr:hypothetical protein B0A48_03370 [Cryoendolithus antarcticus]
MAPAPDTGDSLAQYSCDPYTSPIQSQLAAEIETTQNLLDPADSHPFGALSSLSEACAAVWHDATDFDRASQGYFLFEERTSAWVDSFVTTLRRGEPLALTSAPNDVLDQIRASRPQSVKPRAWLVMYYSIILSRTSSTSPEDKETKAKLRCNLWLALNDMRVLLEPSEVNIQALILVASHVEEFTTPSLCWLLVSNACRMLQALGVDFRNMTPENRHRRRMMFWHLNVIDKGLSMIFGRPPTLHGAMARSVGLPALADLMPSTPGHSSTGGGQGAPGALFGAHFFHQVMQLSTIMGKVWSTVYDHDGDSPDEQSVVKAREDLVAWHDRAQTILRAAAVAEGPLLDAKGVGSLELGVLTTDFYHHHLLILLARNSGNMKSESVSSSIKMLQVLPALVSDSEEVYNGIIWMMVCSPFTAFLTLFGEVVSASRTESTDHGAAIEAMEILPVFLNAMGVRNSLAAKLENVATVLLAHAKKAVSAREESNRTGESMIEQSAEGSVTFGGYKLPDIGLDLLNFPGDEGIFDVDWLNFGETNTDWIAASDWQIT